MVTLCTLVAERWYSWLTASPTPPSLDLFIYQALHFYTRDPESHSDLASRVFLRRWLGPIGHEETYVGKLVSPPDHPHYALVIRIALTDAQHNKFLHRNSQVNSFSLFSECHGRDIAAWNCPFLLTDKPSLMPNYATGVTSQKPSSSFVVA